MRRILTILFSFLAIGMIVAEAGEPCEVQLVTNEDYGLVLDWAIPLKSNASSYGVGIDFIKHDSDGSIYCSGHYKRKLEFPNGVFLSKSDERYCAYIAKFTKEGLLEWCKDFYPSEAGSSVSIDALYGFKEERDELFLALHASNSMNVQNIYYYGEKELMELDGRSVGWMIVSLSMKDGSLKNSFKMKKSKGVSMARMDLDFKMMNNGNFVLGGYIDTTFTGMNGYVSQCRSKKEKARYVIKLDENFNVMSDFSYATELTRVGLEEQTEGELFCVGDTLYNLFHYESKDFNLDPWGESILVNRKYAGPLNEEAGSVILKCDISGDTPKLLGYWHSDRANMPINLQKNSKGNIVGALKSHNSIFSCVEISGSVDVLTLNEIPFQNSSWWWTDVNPIYSFGEEDRICVLGYKYGSNGLSYKFSEAMDSAQFKSEVANYMLSIYGADSVFHSAVATDYVDLMAKELDDKRGCFYLGANNEYNTMGSLRIPIDWDPNPNNQFCNDVSRLYVDIVKYTETFRIKPKVVGNGSIVLQDSFVRFGGSTIIKVIPETGSRVDSVVTSRGEVLVSENGLFEIKNVTDVVDVVAYVSATSGFENLGSSAVWLYPNPTKERLTVEGKRNFDYEILDMQGNSQIQGRSEDGDLDISKLPSGRYILRIEYSYHKFQKN